MREVTSGRWVPSAAASDSDGTAERQRFPLLPSARVGLYGLWMALRETREDVRRERMGLAEQKRQPEDKLTEPEASARVTSELRAGTIVLR